MVQATPSRPVKVILAGMTGAGKTTFASVASGQRLRVGHGLDPCTQEPQAVKFKLDNRDVILIDTPGFDDTTRSDIEILAETGEWLEKQGFTKNTIFDGLILPHPITEERLDSRMEKQRTRLIQDILGREAYKRVIIATTMWGTIAEEYHDTFEEEMGFRKGKGGVRNDFHDGGATFVRHDNTQDSAHRIIRTIVERSARAEETLLQKEMGSTFRFADTSAGRELRAHLEEEIDFIESQLLEHRLERPPDRYRRSWRPAERREWEEWEVERQKLAKSLEMRQGQVRKLNSFAVSAVAWKFLFSSITNMISSKFLLKQAWNRLFG
ncbi:hypothetical protein OQA88_9470 [Cercophora sp. LCS_1]